MTDFLTELLQAKVDTLLVLVGLILLLVAVLGNISGKIQPGKWGRIASAVLGPVLVGIGLWMHVGHLNTDAKAGSPPDSSSPAAGISSDTTTARERNKKTPSLRGSDACAQGYVWREASPSDHVCVTPERRMLTAQQNAAAPSRRNPNGGPFGPDTCQKGYVWRDAFPGDHACVVPSVRDHAAEDNSLAATRLAQPPAN